MTKPKKSPKRLKQNRDGHTIPPPVPLSVLNGANVKRMRNEEQDIREYVEWQCRRERVTHLEKLLTEYVLGNNYDAWDVRTTRDRYWVITSPTNFYSQRLFPSLDYTLSFHIGVTMRVMAQEKQSPSNPIQARLARIWRRLGQASQALDRADEAEEFQAVGLRCRECLVALVRAIAHPSMVPVGQAAPRAADVVQWADLIANKIACGSSASEIRSYLKTVARSTWQLVNWVTHASNAVRVDAIMALEATDNTLAAFERALGRFESGSPDRCPRCASYRVASFYRPELKITPPYVRVCESCGWTDPPSDKGSTRGDHTASVRQI